MVGGKLTVTIPPMPADPAGFMPWRQQIDQDLIADGQLAIPPDAGTILEYQDREVWIARLSGSQVVKDRQADVTFQEA